MANNPYKKVLSNEEFSPEGARQLQENDENKKIIERVESDFIRARNAKSEISAEWNRYFKLYKGDHSIKRSKSWQTKAIENMCFSLVETMVPLMTDRQPEILVLPQEDGDIDVSKKLNAVISYIWNSDNMQEKLVRVIRDQLILGTGILMASWNPEKLPTLGGDIETHVVDPFDFFPDPDATTPEEMEWCALRTRMPLRKIRALFPERGKLVPTNDVYDDSRRETRMTGITSGGKVADVITYWYYDEEGTVRVTTIANGVFLEEKDSPYDQDLGFPFLFFYDHQVNGEFWGIGEFANLEPLQKELNKTRQIIVDNMIANNNTIWLVDKTAGVQKNKLDNQPGSVIEKNPGGNVERVAPPQLPSYFQNHMEATKRSMEEISGIHDVTKGISSGSVTAASAIQILTENSQTRIRSKLRNTEFGIKALGHWYVSLIRDFYDNPRVVRLSGQENFIMFDAKEMRTPQIDPVTQEVVTDPFTGKPVELLSQFDIKITAGSSMMLNKSAIYQQAFELFINGGLDIESLLNISEIGDTQQIIQRLVKYGIIKDPNQKSIDPKSILDGLGLRFNLSSTEPSVVMDALQKSFQQIAQMEQEMGQGMEMGDQPLVQQPKSPEQMAMEQMGQTNVMPDQLQGMNPGGNAPTPPIPQDPNLQQ